MPTRSESRAGSGAGRFMFVVPPWAGHLNPTIPLGRELADRGHTVAWAGHRNPLAELLPSWAPVVPVADDPPADLPEAGRIRKGPAGVKITWQEYMVPFARHMVPGVHAAVEAFSPDVLVVDQQTLAGAAVAEVRGLPWATSASSPAGLIDWAGVGKLREWYDTLLRDFMVESGVEPARAAGLDPTRSPHLLIAYTTTDMMGTSDFPDHYELVGPTLGTRDDTTPFPWEWLEQGSGPCVLVSLGTLLWRSGERFFRTAAETFAAMADVPVRAVVVAPDELVPDPPPNVLVTRRVPQLELLPHVDAVVCHGGHNTVCEALVAGLPLVIAPVHDDQPMIADQITRAGAGLRVKFFRVTPDTLRSALEQVLTEPRYREAAGRLGRSLQAAGGSEAAADRLEALQGHAADVNNGELVSGTGQ
jgi:MGT family glycosyltransferase